MISARDALERLQAGNRRFVSDQEASQALTDRIRRDLLADRQEPFAIIVGCSDSRAPAEIIFDQGLGDLFVIRVAGNIVAPSQIGSVEFAASEFGTQLVVVLGHSMCGAVLATLKELQSPTTARSPNLKAIVDRIRPSIEPVLAARPQQSREDLVQQAIRANIYASVTQLRNGSRILENLIESDRLLVVGAEYSLNTGLVDFFDGLPGRGGSRE